MQTNVVLSIQEYLKKINSRLTPWDSLSILMTGFCVFALALYIHIQSDRSVSSVVYIAGGNRAYDLGKQSTTSESRPFASNKGKTYTFSWCQGSSRIQDKNKIYFDTESSAIASGRTLSKLCKN